MTIYLAARVQRYCVAGGRPKWVNLLPDMVGLNSLFYEFKFPVIFMGIFAKVAGIWRGRLKSGQQKDENSLIIPVFSMGGIVDYSNTATCYFQYFCIGY